MTNSNSPERWSVNGDQASEDEIAFMEGLVSDLLIDSPAEYTSQYGYASEDGSIALFSTTVYEDEPEIGSIATVVISHGTPEDIIFSTNFSHNNKPGHTRYRSEENLGEVTSTIQELLDSGGLPPPDAAILRHIQAIVFCRMNAIIPEHVGILPRSDNTKDYQHVADVIRSQVQKNATGAVRSKLWGIEIDGQRKLTVATNEAIGGLSEDDDLYLPRVVVEYEDLASQVVYRYCREQDGDTSLDTDIITDDEQGSAQTDIDIDEEIVLFAEQLGSSIPGREDVRIIKDVLSEAILNYV